MTLPQIQSRFICALLEHLNDISEYDAYKILDLIDDYIAKVDVKQEYLACHLYAHLGLSTTNDQPIKGAKLVTDLSKLAEIYTHDHPKQIGDVDCILLGDICKQMNVNGKTLYRWSRRGMTRRYCIHRGYRKLVILRHVFDHFRAQNARNGHGNTFVKIAEHERVAIMRRATMLACRCSTMKELSKRVSEACGRSQRVVMSVIRNKVLPNRDEIIKAQKDGKSLGQIAKMLGMSATDAVETMIRLRYDKIAGYDLTPHPEAFFAREFSEEEDAEFCKPINTEHCKSVRIPKDLPVYLEHLYRVPLLTRDQEVHLFRHYNYLKHKALLVFKQIKYDDPDMVRIEEVERLYDEAVSIRNRIICANLRLVVHVSRKRLSPTIAIKVYGHVGGQKKDIFDLITEGNWSLLRAAERFDFTRGFKFCTYATWAIIRNFQRCDKYEPDDMLFSQSSYDDSRYGQRGMNMFEPADNSPDPLEVVDTNEQAGIVLHALNKLPSRTRDVIKMRYGIGTDRRTLEEAGALLNVTKERVRQIEMSGLMMLQRCADLEKLAPSKS